MLVSDLLELVRARTGATLEGPGDIPVTGLAYHSAQVTAGGLFAALPGTRDDGARFVPAALAAGARVVLLPASARALAGERPEGVAFVLAEDVRLALALASAEFHDRPSERLTVAGITGTNGKTTLTWLVESMASAAGIPCGVLGTLGWRLGGASAPADRTTPEAPDLQALLRRLADDGARWVAMEVSSHALAQRRADGTRISFALFTNLTLDHLDYHGDMERYYQAKRRLFTDFTPTASVINLDDPWGRRLAGEAVGEVITYGHQAECHIRPREAAQGDFGLRLTLEVPGGLLRLSSPLVGGHNLQNVLAAAALGWRMGLPEEAIREGIARLREVPGRFQRVSVPGEPLVVVDYAHTPDALRNVLESARKVTAGRLLLVFGCGGDRDPSKRAPMGEFAARLADVTWLTSDNPRGEDPLSILERIEDGYRSVRQNGYRVVADRRQAIGEAVAEAGENDTLVIAGKGHEDYQEVQGTRTHFDDREVARAALDRRRAAR